VAVLTYLLDLPQTVFRTEMEAAAPALGLTISQSMLLRSNEVIQ
jgi:hypothetical protein